MAIITKAFIKMITGHVDKFRMMDSNVGTAFSKKCCSSITRHFAGAVADAEFVKFILFVRPLRNVFLSCQQSLVIDVANNAMVWFVSLVNTNYIADGYLSPKFIITQTKRELLDP